MSLIQTRMLEATSQGNVDQHEVRGFKAGAWDLHRKQNASPMSIVSEEMIAAAQRSHSRGMSVDVLDRNAAVTVSNVRTVDLPLRANSSQKIPITFVTLESSFSLSPAANYTNRMGEYNRLYFNSFKSMSVNFLHEIEDLCLANLESNKSANAGGLTDDLGKYDWLNDQVEVDYDQSAEIFGDIDVLMNGNDFVGPLSWCGNLSSESTIRNKVLEKGQFQESDKTYQWANKDFHFSRKMGSDATYNAKGYVVEDGSVGFITRQEVDAIMQNSSTTGRYFDVVYNDFLGIDMSAYFYSDVANLQTYHGAGTAHLNRGIMELHGFSVDIALIGAYTSDDRKPILKVNVRNQV